MSRPEIDPTPPNLWPLLPKDPPVLSARRQWREENNVQVGYYPNREQHGEYRAQIGFCCVVADSEDEAERALCVKCNISHYST